MSTGNHLACWMRLEHVLDAPREPRRRRPKVPRQRTWTEGRWDALLRTVALPGAATPLLT